jgi:(p)ppGpp synthase/HD superfamily hydrolase
MEKLDYAILFATKAHDGQRRKTDNVDMIFHPFTVGMILQRAGMNEDTVIAGILHDVVEDTKYTINDIEKIFGNNVRKIVDEVTENKSLEWKQRKIEAIEKVRKASFEGKMVECADKINNLESLYDLLKEKGEEVWKNFNKPYPEQKWYYTEMYKAVIENTEYNDLFKRYSNILEKVFD